MAKIEHLGVTCNLLLEATPRFRLDCSVEDEGEGRLVEQFAGYLLSFQMGATPALEVTLVRQIGDHLIDVTLEIGELYTLGELSARVPIGIALCLNVTCWVDFDADADNPSDSRDLVEPEFCLPLGVSRALSRLVKQYELAMGKETSYVFYMNQSLSHATEACVHNGNYSNCAVFEDAGHRLVDYFVPRGDDMLTFSVCAENVSTNEK